MMGLSEKISALSPEKRLLFELMLRQRRGGEAGTEPSDPRQEHSAAEAFSFVSPEDRSKLPAGLEDAYPLASMQLGMLYHMDLTRDEEIPAYHNIFLFDLSFPVVIRALQAALQEVAARHPIFRSSFDLQSFREPLQLVHE